ncbi:hypothetical protein KR074_007677 [Drosophila pseudoananassae]|nr:hypothetical protein KR074_007677 [Drosophila pseudoananassae]
MNQSDLNGRLARWAIKLQGYGFTIVHRKGSENVVADALSRTFESSAADTISALEYETLPQILLAQYVFGQHMLSHGHDFKLLRNLNLLSEGSARLPRSDDFQQIRSSIEKYVSKAYERNKRSYDLRCRPRTFEEGQIVTKRNFLLSKAADHFNAKLAPVGTKTNWKKKLGQSCYLLKDMNGKEIGKYHAKDIW